MVANPIIFGFANDQVFYSVSVTKVYSMFQEMRVLVLTM